MCHLSALIFIVTISLAIVRFGATALKLTVLSWSVANFQAFSAFFGVGFTTGESEMVNHHKLRRRIILHLIVAGNIGITSVLATILVGFVKNTNFYYTLVNILLTVLFLIF